VILTNLHVRGVRRQNVLAVSLHAHSGAAPIAADCAALLGLFLAFGLHSELALRTLVDRLNQPVVMSAHERSRSDDNPEAWICSVPRNHGERLDFCWPST